MQELWLLCMACRLNVLYKCMQIVEISLTVIKSQSGHAFVTDRQTDALTFGFLLGTYSVSKNSQERLSTQQIPDNFYGININFS